MTIRPLSRARLRRFLVPREPADHKGVFGHVLIAAGSRGMAGAAILAARAALRSGAGLVTVAAPKSTASQVAVAVPSAMTLPLPENAAGAFRAEGAVQLGAYAAKRRVSVLAIGPGMTTDPDAVRFLARVLTLPIPAVVDADGLNGLAMKKNAATERTAPIVLTPHPAEAARLLGITPAAVAATRLDCARRLARAYGATVLLKGRGTLISSGTETVVNRTGGPALAKAGSGDVLTGLIAGLWAQALASGRASGDLAFGAAALGAWLHGAAGDAARRDRTEWAATSTDLVEYLPAAFKAL